MIKVKERLRRVFRLVREGREAQQTETLKGILSGVTFISFPKSGRTWLHVMLGHLGILFEYSHADWGHQK